MTTLHGRQDLPDLLPLYLGFDDMPLVSISNAQRRPVPDSNFARTVHHGIPARLHHGTTEARGGYLAFLGRISPEKRPDRAIAIARASGIPLKIAAKVDRADAAYFATEIEPLLKGGGVEFVGEINDHQKTQFLGDAQALLFPIDWPEPFGLSMIEAMACGTPVLAFRCGSVPEIVEDGVTGAIVESMEEAIAACPARYCARSKKGATTLRTTIFCHTNGQRLCRYLSVAVGDFHRARAGRNRPFAKRPGFERSEAPRCLAMARSQGRSRRFRKHPSTFQGQDPPLDRGARSSRAIALPCSIVMRTSEQRRADLTAFSFAIHAIFLTWKCC